MKKTKIIKKGYLMGLRQAEKAGNFTILEEDKKRLIRFRFCFSEISDEDIKFEDDYRRRLLRQRSV